MKSIHILMAVGLYLNPLQLCAVSSNQQSEKYVSFIPSRIWNDTDGKPIEAHGGGMYYENGSYY